MRKKRKAKHLSKVFGFWMKIDLAPSYFSVGLPPEYLRRSNVSQIRVRDGIGVVPLRQRHQESFLFVVRLRRSRQPNVVRCYKLT